MAFQICKLKGMKWPNPVGLELNENLLSKGFPLQQKIEHVRDFVKKHFQKFKLDELQDRTADKYILI
jgi:hypothetical protein